MEKNELKMNHKHMLIKCMLLVDSPDLLEKREEIMMVAGAVVAIWCDQLTNDKWRKPFSLSN